MGEAYVGLEEMHGSIDTKQSLVGVFERGGQMANVVV